MPAGTKDVKVGTLIAMTVGEGEDWKDVATPGAPSATATSASVPAQPVFTGGSGTLLSIYSLKRVMSGFCLVRICSRNGLNKIAVFLFVQLLARDF